MPEAEPARLCPQCQAAPLVLLKRILHDDGASTIYFRCHNCSHLEVSDAPRLDSKSD